jgi:hypothetical protein
MENHNQIKPLCRIDFGGNKGDVLELCQIQNISLVYSVHYDRSLVQMTGIIL